MKQMFYSTIAVELKDTLIRVLNIIAFLVGSQEVVVVGQGVVHEDEIFFVQIFDRIFAFVVYQGYGAIEMVYYDKSEKDMSWYSIARFLVKSGLRNRIDKRWINMMHFNERLIKEAVTVRTSSERIILKSQLKTPPTLKAFLNQ